MAHLSLREPFHIHHSTLDVRRSLGLRSSKSEVVSDSDNSKPCPARACPERSRRDAGSNSKFKTGYACPVSRYLYASTICSSGYSLSITVLNFPPSMSFLIRSMLPLQSVGRGNLTIHLFFFKAWGPTEAESLAAV